MTSTTTLRRSGARLRRSTTKSSGLSGRQAPPGTTFGSKRRANRKTTLSKEPPPGFTRKQYHTLLELFDIEDAEVKQALDAILTRIRADFELRDSIERAFGRWPDQRDRLLAIS